MPDDPVGGEAGAECEEGEPHPQARLRHIFQQEVVPVHNQNLVAFSIPVACTCGA